MFEDDPAGRDGSPNVSPSASRVQVGTFPDFRESLLFTRWNDRRPLLSLRVLRSLLSILGRADVLRPSWVRTRVLFLSAAETSGTGQRPGWPSRERVLARWRGQVSSANESNRPGRGDTSTEAASLQSQRRHGQKTGPALLITVRMIFGSDFQHVLQSWWGANVKTLQLRVCVHVSVSPRLNYQESCGNRDVMRKICLRSEKQAFQMTF